jgi:hypothetical protein
MTDKERDAFANLILACNGHHKRIDGPGSEKEYPVKTLHQWKLEREKGNPADLAGLDGITTTELQASLITSITEAKEEILDAISSLGSRHDQAAELLHDLVKTRSGALTSTLTRSRLWPTQRGCW